MKITSKQVSEYYKEKGASEECPFCKQFSWTIPLFDQEHRAFNEDEVMDTAVSKIELISSHVPWENAVIQTMVLVCNNCGFVRHQSVNHIAEWMESKGYRHG